MPLKQTWVQGKTVKLETKTAEFCSAAENLKLTVEQMGHDVKNAVSEKLDSLRVSSQNEG